MSLPTRSVSPEVEEILEVLRYRYENEGYKFTIAPDASMLPYSNSYAPDALAQKPGRNIAIEIKSPRSKTAQMQLQQLHRLFEKHPDWELNVVFAGGTPEKISVPLASPIAIKRRLDETRAMAAEKHDRGAFVMLWSLLEAIAQSAEGRSCGPLTPGTVVQSLVMNGLLDPDIEPRLRGLIALRNHIVHGDVDAEPTATDIELLLSVAEEALSVEAA